MLREWLPLSLWSNVLYALILPRVEPPFSRCLCQSQRFSRQTNFFLVFQPNFSEIKLAGIYGFRHTHVPTLTANPSDSNSHDSLLSPSTRRPSNQNSFNIPRKRIIPGRFPYKLNTRIPVSLETHTQSPVFLSYTK